MRGGIPLVCRWRSIRICHALIFPGFPFSASKTGHERIALREQYLLAQIFNPAVLVISLKGLPGTGKSYTVQQVLAANPNIILYEGEAKIQAWLDDKVSDGQVKVLSLDEANLKPAG